MIATLINKLQQIEESKDWRGKLKWVNLGSQTHCWRCGGEFGKDKERGSEIRHHIIPESEGGPDTVDNKSLLCGDCHNVVHKYYIPTAKIGKKRTRNGSWRLVAKFKEGIKISHSILATDGSLASCGECNAQGVVVGVSEGYWDSQGMIVFLDCPKCGRGYAVPFIGTDIAPDVDQAAVFFSEMEASFKASSENLPPELSSKVQDLGRKFVTILRDFRKELKKITKDARESGCTDEEIEHKTVIIRKKYGQMITSIMPEAASLEQTCKEYSGDVDLNLK
jgi:hypothetical protein